MISFCRNTIFSDKKIPKKLTALKTRVVNAAIQNAVKKNKKKRVLIMRKVYKTSSQNGGHYMNIFLVRITKNMRAKFYFKGHAAFLMDFLVIILIELNQQLTGGLHQSLTFSPRCILSIAQHFWEKWTLCKNVYHFRSRKAREKNQSILESQYNTQQFGK